MRVGFSGIGWLALCAVAFAQGGASPIAGRVTDPSLKFGQRMKFLKGEKP